MSKIMRQKIKESLNLSISTIANSAYYANLSLATMMANSGNSEGGSSRAYRDAVILHVEELFTSGSRMIWNDVTDFKPYNRKITWGPFRECHRLFWERMFHR